VIQRINAHYGWACVAKIVLRQGRVDRIGRKVPPPVIDPVRRGEVALAVGTIGDDALRDALDRLGTAVVATSSKAAPRR